MFNRPEATFGGQGNEEKKMGIHSQNCVRRDSVVGSVSSMGLNPAYLDMVCEEAIRACPQASAADVRAMLCGL